MSQFPRLLYYPIRWLISSALSTLSFRAVFPDTIGPTQQIVENVLGSKYPGWTLFMDDWPFVLNRVPTPTSALALEIEMGTFRNSSFHTVMLDNAVPKCFSWVILYLLGLQLLHATCKKLQNMNWFCQFVVLVSVGKWQILSPKSHFC